MDTLAWMKAVVQEILYEMSARDATDKNVLPTSVVTDCKSLYDTLTKERVMLLDRRLSLEAAIMRQTLQQTAVKWVKSEQMLADCLTKRLPGSYTRRVLTDGIWTLGPDDRAPSFRHRKLADPKQGPEH